MTPCPDCDRFVANSETACPHCKRSLAASSGWKRIFVASAGTIMLAACYGSPDMVIPVDSGIDDTNVALDEDADGFDVNEDCDDTNAEINPDADEVCDDEIDNDCDELVDADDEECGEA